MNTESDIELFVLKNAVIKAELDKALGRTGTEEPLGPNTHDVAIRTNKWGHQGQRREDGRILQAFLYAGE